MIIPINTDNEILVLAMAMMDPDFMTIHGCKIQGEDFTMEWHRRIWAMMQRLTKADRPTDRSSLYSALVEANSLDDVGGTDYLFKIDANMPTIAGAENYVRILIEYSNRRRVMLQAEAIYNRAQDMSIEADVLVADAEKSFADIARRSTVASEYISAGKMAEEHPGGFEYLISPNKYPGARGIPTTLESLNNMLGGLRPGELVIVAARPSMGKSALVLQIAGNASVNLRKHTGIVSLEMEKPTQFRRMTSQLSKVNYSDMIYGNMTQEERARVTLAAHWLTTSPIYFDACRQNTHQAITSCAIRQQSREGLDLLIVDHLHLMVGPEKELRHMLGNITKGLKDLASNLKIPILLAAQLSRKCDDRSDKRPVMSDLLESGQIEADADAIMFIYRGERYYKDDSSLIGRAEILLEKQRDGPTGKVECQWKAQYQSFTENEYE